MSYSEKPKSWRERRQSIKHKWQAPFIFCVEWPCEWISYWLGEWAFLDILGHIGRLTILIAVITYFMGADERRMQGENQRKAKQYQAWQVINIAQGKPGGGGRKEALEDLSKDEVPLTGVDISKAFLQRLNLPGANLDYANLSKAILWDVNLARADLTYADLSEADLIRADLSKANLTRANLSKAILWDVNLARADLTYANLTETDCDRGIQFMIHPSDRNVKFVIKFPPDGANLQNVRLVGADLHAADLVWTDLTGADLSYANLAGADLAGANLEGVNLQQANLKEIRNWRNIWSVKYANIYDVNDHPEGFKKWAKEKGAVEIENDEEWIEYKRKKMQEQMKEK